MKTIFTYRGDEYGYVVIDAKVVPFKVEKNMYENEVVLDDEMQKQLEAEFAAYEATLNEKELKIWRGE